jgi:hypothetical protein
MPNRSYILAENIDSIGSDQFSDKNKGASYHLRQGGSHTFVYSTENFIGSISLQGTLETYPGDSDWVDVIDTEFLSSNLDSSISHSGNFVGNFVWIRAKYTVTSGKILQIRYNY